MTTDTDKLVESFADAFFEHLKHGDAAHKQWLREETDKFFAAHAPAFRDRIIASLCGDVEPVAFMFQHSETGRVTFVDAWQKENGWSAGNPRFKEVGALYGASTLAAAQALNAELVARVEGLEKDAARYRHLRGHRGMEHDSFAVHSTLTDDLLWGDDLDHEIDRIAAIAARSGT